jgi:hypothetical protein
MEDSGLIRAAGPAFLGGVKIIPIADKFKHF